MVRLFCNLRIKVDNFPFTKQQIGSLLHKKIVCQKFAMEIVLNVLQW